ncbi:hypothetical protein FACS189493_8300 [Spirochaetia bacterium]|nr:hypothetical protein FACS189493_8300 [Spirochaetia bacterium]
MRSPGCRLVETVAGPFPTGAGMMHIRPYMPIARETTAALKQILDTIKTA